MGPFSRIYSYLSWIVPYNQSLDDDIEEAVRYVRNNPNNDASGIFKWQVKQNGLAMIEGLRYLAKQFKEKTITHPLVLNKLAVASTPGRSREEMFLFKLYCACNNIDYSNISSFGDIIKTLLKDYPDDYQIILKNMKPEYLKLSYDISHDGNDYAITQKQKRFDYMNGLKKLDGKELNCEQRQILGFAAEFDFCNNFTFSEDELVIWVSRYVDQYSPLDFIVYNFKTGHVTIREIKSTVYGICETAYISDNEATFMERYIDDPRVTYVVTRIKYDEQLKRIIDGVHHVIENRSAMHAFDLNNKQISNRRCCVINYQSDKEIANNEQDVIPPQTRV